MSRAAPVTVVLDAPSAGLEPAVTQFAPTLIFHASGGFLSSPEIAVEELRREFATKGIDRVILVAASFGGFAALTFARQYPEMLAGLILLDASHPQQTERALSALASVSSTPSVEAFKKHLRGFGSVWDESCRAMNVHYSLGNLPLVVLAAGLPEMPAELSAQTRDELTRGWHDLQRHHAMRSSRGELRIVAGAGHDLPRFAPEDVLRAIRDVVALAQELD